ncbi:MAG TPA: amino acid adenylation domain-containing protein, partial [Longimicrobiaceae bacterium]
GDSILSLRVLARARERGLALSLPQLFRHQTVEALAAAVEEEARAEEEPVPFVRTEPFSGVSAEDRARLPDDVVDAYPLARLQEGMLLHMELTPERPLYHNVDTFALAKPFRRGALEEAVRRTVARHPMLRTGFHLRGFAGPLQLVHREARLRLTDEDLRGLPAAERDAAVRAYMRAQVHEPFDLTRPPLLRFHVQVLEEERFQLTLTECHAIFDGWSLTTTLGEIFTLYGALLRGEDPPVAPPPSTRYRDFVALERRTLESAAVREWWERRLAGVAPERLPRLAAPAPGTPPRVVLRMVELPEEVVDGVRRLEAAASVPRKTVLLAVHLRVLSLLAGSAEVVTGLTANGRPETEDGEEVRGLFLNTLPFRHRLPEGSWTELARSVFAAEREVLPFRRYPLAAIQEARRGEPLLESMFNFVHFHGLQEALRAERLEGVAVEEHAETNFTLVTTFAVGTGGRVGLMVAGDAAALGDELLEAVPGHYLEAFRALAEAPEARHDARPLLPETTLRRVLGEWNGPARGWPEACVHELFAAQAARTPDAPALAHRGGRTTYAELERRANRLAHALRRRGVGPETRVGVCMGRTPELAAALLGVLGAGGAYVPLDPAYPGERLRQVLEDGGVRLVLTETALAGRLPGGAAELLLLDLEREALAREPEHAPESGVLPGNLAYVIFTSGSTGRPKGVMVRHASVAARVRWLGESVGDDERAAALFSTSAAFDISVAELFGTLCNGGMLVVAEDALELARLPAGEEVVLASLVPSVAAGLLRADGVPRSVRAVNLCGEALPLSVARSLHALGHVETVRNLYGPTEDTIYSTCSVVEPDAERVLVGRPLAGTRAYVLDAALHPAPPGVTGELYLAGAGLARGYAGRPDLTAERFLPDPFPEAPGARMYRTGDLARWLPCGELEHAGRADTQVKVRGFRVELGEIEAALGRHPAVRDAVAAVREERIVAYAVLREGDEPAPAELRAHLARHLPEYMVPSAVVAVERFPLSPNGKLDRAALPDPEPAREEAYVLPRTPAEERMAGIWAEVLGVERVGAEDAFFALGGHSLLATRAASRVREAFGVDLPLRAVFEAPTLADLVRRVEGLRTGGASGGAVPPLVPVPRDGSPLPLSFAQQRLWFLDRLEPGSAAYNMLLALRLRGPLDARALERAVAETVRRHEALRTVFVEVEGGPAQVARPAGAEPLPVAELAALSGEAREAEVRRVLRDEERRPFDLHRGPLFHARLLRLAAEEHVLVLALHHVVGDAWSMGVLAREVAALYEAFSRGEASPLADLPVQYADFAAWQREWLARETLERQLAWWRESLAGAPAVLEIPTDHPRRASPGERAATVSRRLPREASARLRALAGDEGATPFMVLLAALDLLLARWSGEEDVVVGSPIAGRTRRETEGVVGFFVNTLVLRTDVSGNPTFRELLARVREATLGAYQHQDLPFERLVEALGVERSLARTPLFQVLLLLDDGAVAPLPFGGMRVEPVRGGAGAAKFDLAVSVAEGEEGLGVGFVYREELWDASTLERVADAFVLLLETAAADPGRRVLDFPLAAGAERDRVLREWSGGPPSLPLPRPVHERVAEQAARAPEAVAVVAGAEALTRGELDARANRLAHALRARGVGPETRVGVCLERTPELPVALLAVLRAGGAYVPLDPAHPAERLRYVLADSAPVAVLTQAP